MTKTCTAALAGVAILLAGCATPSDPVATPNVTIERLITISDGDHAASTYVDGRLGAPGHRDVLTTLSLRDGEVHTAEVAVSNSVTAAPEVLALTPAGDTAFVLERLRPRAPGDRAAADLAPGTQLAAVDVADLTAPQTVATTEVAPTPEALAVSPDGRRIAVVANPPSGPVLQVFPWEGAAFGTATYTELALDGVAGPDDTATNVQWHPDGAAIAVNVNTRGHIAFFAIDDAGALTPWGAPVPVGVDPYVGRFTPDGRHYLVANWGRDLSTTVAAERLPDARSTLSVIEVGAVGDPTADHQVVAEEETDISSEGLAVSPDGTLVATVNMRGTVFPPGSPKFDEQASVSLLRLESDGALTKIADTPLTAVLPEGGTFDRSGRFFIATSFQGRDGDGGSGLQVYRVEDTGLVPAQRIMLAHGAHQVAAG